MSSSTAHVMSSALSKEECTFIGLPLEVRQIIYENLLVTEYNHPGPPQHLRHIYQDVARLSAERQELPATKLFLVSKQVAREARQVFYGRNKFTTFFGPNYNVGDAIETVAGGSAGTDVWTQHRSQLVRAVSSIYDPNPKNVPEWLFGDLAPMYETGEAEHYTIGADNASLITTIKIQLGGFRLSTKVLPIYVETLIQHVKGLSKVILEFHGFNNYGPRLTLDQRASLLEELILEFFNWLRILLRGSPALTNLELRGCAEEIKAMGRLVVDEKLTGVAQDLGREWRIKYAAAKQRALADPASVDEYGIYRHNWRCETRVVRQMIVSSDGSVREIWHRQL